MRLTAATTAAAIGRRGRSATAAIEGATNTLTNTTQGVTD